MVFYLVNIHPLLLHNVLSLFAGISLLCIEKLGLFEIQWLYFSDFFVVFLCLLSKF